MLPSPIYQMTPPSTLFLALAGSPCKKGALKMTFHWLLGKSASEVRKGGQVRDCRKRPTLASQGGYKGVGGGADSHLGVGLL